MKRLLRLYPRAWRHRYEEEMAALLEQCPATPLVVIDLLLGAMDAHLHSQLGDERIPAMNNAPRTAVIAVFCAYIGFVIAGVQFYAMVDDSPFIPAMRAHLELLAPWYTVMAGSAIALAAVALGGIPIGLAMVQRAIFQARKDLRFLLTVPVASLAALALYFALITALYDGLLQIPGVVLDPIPPGQPIPPANLALLMLGGGIFVLGAIASTVAVCVAVARTELEEQSYRALGIALVLQPYSFALLAAAVTTAAMVLLLAGTLTWGAVAGGLEPRAFGENLGQWWVIVSMMAISTAIALVATLRGLLARTARAS